MPVHTATRSGVYSRALRQLIESVRHRIDVGAILQSLIQDDVHHAQCEGPVCSWPDGNVPIRQRGGACAIGIDDDQTRAIAPSLLNEWPQVHIVAVNVCAPGEYEFGEAEVFGRGAKFFPVDQLPGLAPCF